MNEGFWKQTKNKYPGLDRNIETEILVIGGGICGVLCAYQLSLKGFSVVLVEKDELGSHRTARTTAIITAL